MSNRIPTQKGPDSPDSAYTDKRYRPIMSNMGIEPGDTVQSPHYGDTWTVEAIRKDRATIRHKETGNVERVYDSWFKSVELIDD